jgi:acetylornithine deacetylase/succinyl-diaminopimelate desuccinylase-like protein
LSRVALDGFVDPPGTDLGVARKAHACTHTTLAPTIISGGTKTNVIPDVVDLQVDIRALPGDRDEDVADLLREAIGPELAPHVQILADAWNPGSVSSIRSPLWDSLSRVSAGLVPGSRTVPFLMVGATDARFFRAAGATAYGYSLFSDRITFAEFGAMFHGDNERIDSESLRLCEALWENVAVDFLS